jgi:hypothetical protein
MNLLHYGPEARATEVQLQRLRSYRLRITKHYDDPYFPDLYCTKSSHSMNLLSGLKVEKTAGTTTLATLHGAGSESRHSYSSAMEGGVTDVPIASNVYEKRKAV